VAKGKLILRRFQYLDASLVRQYLAQVPGGIEVPTRGTRESKGQLSVGAGAGYGPLSARAGKDKSTTETTEYQVEKSAPADFNRLHALATEQGLVQPLSALDEAIWDQLQVGELLEVRVIFALPKIHEWLAAVDQYKELAPVMSAFGQGLTADQAQALSMIDDVAPMLRDEKPTLIGSLVGSPKFRLAVPVAPSNLLVPLQDIQGEATVLAAVERKSVRGGFITIADMVKNLQAFLPNRAARRTKAKGTGSAVGNQDRFLDEQELRIGHPAALVTPVAIYR